MKAKRPPFDKTKTFVVNKPFKFAGRELKVNEEFKWRKLSCSVRKLIQLYDMRKISISEVDGIETEEDLRDESSSSVSSDEDVGAHNNSSENDSHEDESSENEYKSEVSDDENENSSGLDESDHAKKSSRRKSSKTKSRSLPKPRGSN